MNEFALIDAILATLGPVSRGGAVRVGPGDDAAVVTVSDGMEVVSSIDALVAGVHFPVDAAPELVGYRAIMVSASDLAAMGAQDGFALVALNLPGDDPDWVRGLARGMRQAVERLGMRLVGGNIARGPLAITVSVHGFAPRGTSLLREGAQPGDRIWVTGDLGGAAAALARGGLESMRSPDVLDGLARRYFMPCARLPEGALLRSHASSAIDVSDGLLQDLDHLLVASGVGAHLESAAIPLAPGASLAQALAGGDDYELCFTAAGDPPDLAVPVHCIGTIVADPGLWLDDRRVMPSGFRHFN